MPINAIGQSAAILDSDFIALVVVKDRHIVWANTAMHRIFGYATDELIGRSTREMFLDQASYEEFGREVTAAIQNNGTYCVTVPQRRKNGSTGWYEFNISRHADQPDYQVAAIVDRTASHELADQLRASELRYRSVVEDQTEVISRILPDGTFVFVNDIYCRVFGKSAEELIGSVWHPVAHPDDLPMIEARLREMAPDNPVVTIENRVYVASGELRWMQFINRGFFDTDGQLGEIQSVGRDITKRKHTELVLAEREERLELALAGSGLALWDWDLTTGSILFSERWYDMLGYPTETTPLHVDHWKRLFNPSDLIRVEGLVTTYLAGETANLHSEHRVRHREGYWVTVEATGKITQRDASGSPLRIVGTALDVSHKKRLNEEGINLLKQIEALIRESTSSTPAHPADNAALEILTKRERQILGMIAEGMTSAQIAKQLQLSPNTIVSHRKNLMAKLDLHTTAEVTRFAMDHGLLKPKR